MNHHMLLHLKKSVIDHGPLWCSSLFVFEDWNGDIASYFHGTQNVPHQVSFKLKDLWDFSWLVKQLKHLQLEPKALQNLTSSRVTNVMLSCLLLFYFKIMTAVTSHQHLPKLIDEMPPGCAKDLVFQLSGRSDRLASHHAINEQVPSSIFSSLLTNVLMRINSKRTDLIRSDLRLL